MDTTWMKFRGGVHKIEREKNLYFLLTPNYYIGFPLIRNLSDNPHHINSTYDSVTKRYRYYVADPQKSSLFPSFRKVCDSS